MLFVVTERHEERAGDGTNVRDAVRRHGPAAEVARRANRGRVQEAHVGTHEGTGRRTNRRNLATQTVTRVRRPEG